MAAPMIGAPQQNAEALASHTMRADCPGTVVEQRLVEVSRHVPANETDTSEIPCALAP